MLTDAATEFSLSFRRLLSLHISSSNTSKFPLSIPDFLIQSPPLWPLCRFVSYRSFNTFFECAASGCGIMSVGFDITVTPDP